MTTSSTPYTDALIKAQKTELGLHLTYHLLKEMLDDTLAVTKLQKRRAWLSRLPQVGIVSTFLQMTDDEIYHRQVILKDTIKRLVNGSLVRQDFTRP